MSERPVTDIKAISLKLPEPCIDAVYIKTAGNKYWLIASTDTGLYLFEQEDGSWEILL